MAEPKWRIVTASGFGRPELAYGLQYQLLVFNGEPKLRFDVDLLNIMRMFARLANESPEIDLGDGHPDITVMDSCFLYYSARLPKVLQGIERPSWAKEVYGYENLATPLHEDDVDSSLLWDVYFLTRVFWDKPVSLKLSDAILACREHWLDCRARGSLAQALFRTEALNVVAARRAHGNLLQDNGQTSVF